MTLEDLSASGQIRRHRTSSKEITDYLSLIERDLRECETKGLGLDWRFSIAFNAILQVANAALAAVGYRTGRKAHQATAIESLQCTLDLDKKTYRLLDTFRTKRNVARYDMTGTISEEDVHRMIMVANDLFRSLVCWLKDNHPHLMS
ncbi:hypothetical protein KAU45_02105 [bacterium]|nr:hypothetical protein [bacterium]